jgi:hypothetical protein
VQWLLDRDVVDMAQELADFFGSFVTELRADTEAGSDLAELS